MPFLGVNRTAELASWGEQGPNYKAKVNIPWSWGITSTSVVPKYSVSANSNKTAITNSNYFNSWTAATLDCTNASTWNPNCLTMIQCMRIPTGFWDSMFPSPDSGGVFMAQQTVFVDGSDVFYSNWDLALSDTRMLTANFGGSGNYTGTYYGSTTPATILENRWISVCISIGPRTSFSNYNTSQGGTNTYAGRCRIHDAVTGELLYSRDMSSFNWTTSPPAINAWTSATASQSSSTTGIDWRLDIYRLTGGTGSFTGTIDYAQIWYQWGTFFDPATNLNWIGNAIPTNLNGSPAWEHLTFTDVWQDTGAQFTYVSGSPTALCQQTNDLVMLAGGNGGAQYSYSNTVYPGS